MVIIIIKLVYGTDSNCLQVEGKVCFSWKNEHLVATHVPNEISIETLRLNKGWNINRKGDLFLDITDLQILNDSENVSKYFSFFVV